MKMKNKKASVAHIIILFFFILSLIELSSLWATVSWESKIKPFFTDVAHPVDVLDQHLVVALDVDRNFV